MSATIQEHDFDLAEELGRLRAGSAKIGAIVSFVGLVRDFSEGRKIEQLYLEHYPGMCHKALQGILGEANSRWQLLGVRVIHRVGVLLPNEQIVLVAAAAPHRADAFAACEFMIDSLKAAVPLWKKEQTQQGAQWLTTKDSDLKRMARWHALNGRQAA